MLSILLLSLIKPFQMMSAIKTGAVSHSRFAHMAELESDLEYGKKMERSGGGV